MNRMQIIGVVGSGVSVVLSMLCLSLSEGYDSRDDRTYQRLAALCFVAALVFIVVFAFGRMTSKSKD